jgi:thiamine kinase-like enzyme
LNKIFKQLGNDVKYRFTVRWVKNKWQKEVKYLRRPEKKIYLNHGDPVSNAIINGKKLYMIDWEYVHLAYDPGLGYMFVHGDLDEEQQQRLLAIYAEVSGEDKSQLEKNARVRQKQLLLLNVLEFCTNHQRNTRLYKQTKPLDSDFIKYRMRQFAEI